jgi:hypothetical protein
VIAVGVGEDDPFDFPDIFPQCRHPLRRLPEALSGVEQDGGFSGLKEITIAVASGCDDGQFHDGLISPCFNANPVNAFSAELRPFQKEV